MSTYQILYGVYAGMILAVTSLVNETVPSPYMDELFHVSQAQHYCDGDWNHWDPKLTTPAGLYLPAAVLAHLFPAYRNSLCSIEGLRGLNALILIALPSLYSSILHRLRHPVLRPSTRGKQTASKLAQEIAEREDAAIEGLILGLFPVVWFFGFLFYTDLGSLALVLLSYERSLQNKWFSSALLGGLSLLFRQTNIIWLAFIAAVSVARTIASVSELDDPLLLTAKASEIPRTLFSLLQLSLYNITSIFDILCAYLPVFVAAGTFVYTNGGIVLGDKQNHVPTLHVPQIYYFVAFTAAFLAPSILSIDSLKLALRSLFGNLRRILASTVAIGFICWTISRFTISHPFLLADNRHYAFYVWRRILNSHPLARYLLSPGYLFATRLLYDRLASSLSFSLLPTIFYVAALALTLVPSPLIEPRYFIIPYILLSLQLRISGNSEQKRRKFLIQGGLYSVINAVSLWAFLNRPFLWDNIQGLQRFMW